jgi:hypothetical protein
LRLKWYFKLILILLLSGIFLFVALEIVKFIDYHNSDFFTFWLAGHMMWTAQNPYLTTDWINGHNQFGVTWIPNGSFVYPLPLALFYAPLGYFSLYTAFVTWIFLLEVMITVSVLAIISLQPNPARKYYIFPILAGAALFRPTFIILFGGQISGLLLFILTGVILLWGKEKWLWGGMLLALVVLKPNIGGPILLIISFWLLIQKRVAALAGMAISGLALMLIGLMLNLNWVVEYLAIGSSKMSQNFGISPTLWGVAAYITGFNIYPAIFLGGVAIAIVLTGVFTLIWRKQKAITPAWMVSMAITTTLLVTPYTWPYDQILLVIPIITIIMEMMTRKVPFWLTSILFLLLDMLAIALFLISARIQMETLSVLVPLIIFGGLVFCIVPVKK